MCFCSTGILAAGPVAGYLFEDFKDANAMQWFTRGMTVVGGALLLVVRFCGWPKFWSIC